MRPDATSTTITHALDLSAKQSIPSDGVRVLDVISNTDGSPIRKIDRAKLTELVPSWTRDTGTEIEFFMFDEENPTIFWVYPTLEEVGSVELVYSQSPADFTMASTGLGVSDIYIAAIYEWVFYRCLSMNSKRLDTSRAQAHLRSFYSAVGAKTQSDSLLMQVQE